MTLTFPSPETAAKSARGSLKSRPLRHLMAPLYLFGNVSRRPIFKCPRRNEVLWCSIHQGLEPRHFDLDGENAGVLGFTIPPMPSTASPA